MSDAIISIKNLGKKYTLSHKHGGNYVALRDVITEKIKSIGQGILRPSAKRHQSKSEEEFWALKDVSLDIKQGEVLGIIGRNGAGKSTLLKILSRITEPTTGRIHIKGRVASLLEVGTGFHPELTGRENIFLNGSILGMGRAEIKKKFDEIVEFAEIEKFLDTPVKRYSSGMYVRLAFAVAANLETDILVVDEVLAVGDIEFQKKCLGKMQDVGRKEGRTVLFVSHNINAIRNLCKRVVWIEQGRIEDTGDTFDIVRKYEENQTKSNCKTSNFSIRNSDEIAMPDFYFNSVEMQNIDGKNSSIFKYLDKFVMMVELSGTLKTKFYNVEFRIYKETGEFVCVGSSGAFHGISFNKGTKNIKIDVGPLILTNGKYNISLTLIVDNIRKDIWLNACSFYIVECHPFALKQEIKKPVCVIKHNFFALD